MTWLKHDIFIFREIDFTEKKLFYFIFSIFINGIRISSCFSWNFSWNWFHGKKLSNFNFVFSQVFSVKLISRFFSSIFSYGNRKTEVTRCFSKTDDFLWIDQPTIIYSWSHRRWVAIVIGRTNLQFMQWRNKQQLEWKWRSSVGFVQRPEF